MDDVNLKHRAGCPNEGDQPGEPDTRVEQFEADSPERGRVVVTRCKQCAEQRIDPKVGR